MSKFAGWKMSETDEELMACLESRWGLGFSDTVRQALRIAALGVDYDHAVMAEDLRTALGFSVDQLWQYIRARAAHEVASDNARSDRILAALEKLAAFPKIEKEMRLWAESQLYHQVIETETSRIREWRAIEVTQGEKRMTLADAVRAMNLKTAENAIDAARPDRDERVQAAIDKTIAEEAKYAVEHPAEQEQGRKALMAKYEEHVKKTKKGK